MLSTNWNVFVLFFLALLSLILEVWNITSTINKNLHGTFHRPEEQVSYAAFLVQNQQISSEKVHHPYPPTKG